MWKKAISKISDIYKYYHATPWIFYVYDMPDTDEEYIHYVSKNPNEEIIGLFIATIDRVNNYISSMTIIRFVEESYFIFSRDTIDFLKELLIKRGFRKVVFSAIVDNPAVAIYKRFITKYNLGKIIGIYKEHRKMRDGKLYDEIYFEIYHDKFIEYSNRPILNKNI
jgi:hypothetical protein